MFSVLTHPQAQQRHAEEYKRLTQWFQRRRHELQLEVPTDHDPLDPFHPYNMAFEPLLREAEQHWQRVHNYRPSPLQLTHAFFQMDNPIRCETLTA